MVNSTGSEIQRPPTEKCGRYSSLICVVVKLFKNILYIILGDFEPSKSTEIVEIAVELTVETVIWEKAKISGISDDKSSRGSILYFFAV